MHNGHTIGAVIPTGNRDELVECVLADLPSFVDRAYVVDDGSPEDVWTTIRRRIDRYNDESGGPFEDRIVAIRDDCERNIGWAIKTGYLRARREAIDVTVVLGGDDRMDHHHLEQCLSRVVDEVADLQPLIAIDPEEAHV